MAAALHEFPYFYLFLYKRNVHWWRYEKYEKPMQIDENEKKRFSCLIDRWTRPKEIKTQLRALGSSVDTVCRSRTKGIVSTLCTLSRLQRERGVGWCLDDIALVSSLSTLIYLDATFFSRWQPNDPLGAPPLSVHATINEANAFFLFLSFWSSGVSALQFFLLFSRLVYILFHISEGYVESRQALRYYHHTIYKVVVQSTSHCFPPYQTTNTID